MEWKYLELTENPNFEGKYIYHDSLGYSAGGTGNANLKKI
jgi:hypothetical protein